MKTITFKFSDEITEKEIRQIEDTLQYVLDKEFNIIWDDDEEVFIKEGELNV